MEQPFKTVDRQFQAGEMIDGVPLKIVMDQFNENKKLVKKFEKLTETELKKIAVLRILASINSSH